MRKLRRLRDHPPDAWRHLKFRTRRSLRSPTITTFSSFIPPACPISSPTADPTVSPHYPSRFETTTSNAHCRPVGHCIGHLWFFGVRRALVARASLPGLHSTSRMSEVPVIGMVLPLSNLRAQIFRSWRSAMMPTSRCTSRDVSARWRWTSAVPRNKLASATSGPA